MNEAIKNIDTQHFLEHLPAGVVIHNMDTSIAYANTMALNILGITWEQAIGKMAIDKQWHFVDEHGLILKLEEYPVNQILNSQKPLNELIIGIKVNDITPVKWVIVNAYLDDTKNEQQIVVTFTEISLAQKLSFKEVVDKAQDAVVITSAHSIEEPHGPIIEYVNDAFCKISGYEKEEVLGKTPRILQRDDIDRDALKRIKTALINKESVRETLLNYSKDNKPYWLDISIFPLHGFGNKITHFAAIERDISQIKYSEISHMEASRTDPLTKLLNRRGFDILSEELYITNEVLEYNVILIDIDYFKKINDTYGHDIGDKVLIELSNLIKRLFRKDDLCARIGGEEFLIFLPNINLEQTVSITQRLKEEVEKSTLYFDNQELKFTISAGVSHAQKKELLKECIKNADLALYKAKSAGRNQIKSLTIKP